MTLLLTISPRTVALIRSASAAREASRTKPLVYVCSRFGNFGSGNALEGSDDHIDKSSEAQFWGMTVVMPNWAIWNAVKHFDVEDANFFTNYTDSVLKAAVLAKMLLETLFLVWVLRGGLKTICFWFEVNVLIEIFGLAAACNSYYTSWHLVLGNLCFGIGSVLMAAYYAFRFLKQLSRSDRAEAVKGLYFVLVFACRVLSVYIFMILHKMFQCADRNKFTRALHLSIKTRPSWQSSVTLEEQSRSSSGTFGIRYCGLEKYANTKVLEKQRYCGTFLKTFNSAMQEITCKLTPTVLQKNVKMQIQFLDPRRV